MALLNLGGVEDAEVELVWDPPWHPSMMTDGGPRAMFGADVKKESQIKKEYSPAPRHASREPE